MELQHICRIREGKESTMPDFKNKLFSSAAFVIKYWDTYCKLNRLSR